MIVFSVYISVFKRSSLKNGHSQKIYQKNRVVYELKNFFIKIL